MSTINPSLRRRVVLCLGIGLVLAAVQMAPQRGAWWGLMDDAEPLRWRAASSSLLLRDVPHVLATTELGAFGRATRYRPVYYAGRALEAWAWGARPARWYAARVVLFGVALAGAAFALWSFCGGWLAAGGMALILGDWYWGDVWAHLGPAEQYASVGTAAVAVGLALALRDGRRVPGLWLAALGVVVAAGSKENFTVLLVPLVMLAWRERRSRAAALSAAAISSAVVGIVVLALLFGLRHATTDIYGTAVSANVRFAWLKGPAALALSALWIAAALAIALMRRLKPGGDAGANERHAAGVALAAVVAFVTILLASQLTYYAPQWPRFGSRYDFPGWLSEVLLVMGGAVYVRRWLQLAGRPEAAVRLEQVVVLVCVALAARHGDLSVRVAAKANAANTIALRETLMRARDSAAVTPATPVVVDVRDDGVLEPAFATIALLAELGCQGPFYLRPLPQPAESIAGTQGLDSISRDGQQLGYQAIRPVRELDEALSFAGGRVVVVTVLDYRLPTLRYRMTP